MQSEDGSNGLFFQIYRAFRYFWALFDHFSHIRALSVYSLGIIHSNIKWLNLFEVIYVWAFFRLSCRVVQSVQNRSMTSFSQKIDVWKNRYFYKFSKIPITKRRKAKYDLEAEQSGYGLNRAIFCFSLENLFRAFWAFFTH